MRHWHDLADTLADLIIKETQGALSDALDAVEQILLEQNNQGGPGASIRMDSMLSLRMERSRMLERWPERVRTYSRNFGNAPVTLGELTLVTDAEMEASLAAWAMGENFSRNQRALSKALEAQFGKILDMSERGSIEGIRLRASASEAPIHPFGLAQLVCSWLLEWDCPEEDRMTAIAQVEKKFIEVLPRLLPAGLAAIENFLNEEKPDISEILDISGSSAVGSPGEPSNTALPDDVLPLMGNLSDNSWMATLAQAQEGLYDASAHLEENSSATSPQPTAPGTRFTPEYSSLMEDGGSDPSGGAVNTPLYLDDLINRRRGRGKISESLNAPPVNYPFFDDSEGVLANAPGIDQLGQDGLSDFGAAGPVNIPPVVRDAPDSRTLASALMRLMSGLGPWTGLNDSDADLNPPSDLDSRQAGRLPQGGREILEQARTEGQLAQQEAIAAQQLKYTGKRGYDPTLSLAQIDESEFDPAMAELFSLIQARRKSSRRGQNFEQATRPRISPADLGQALRALQRNPDQSIIEAARNAGRMEGVSLAQALKDAIIKHSRKAGAPQDSELDDADSDAADIVGMLFEIFLTERQIEDQMKGQIAKLVAPYVRVAVNDRKMFMQKNHPARRYLDTLAAAVDGNQGANFQERQILDKARSSIDRLAESFNEDLAIFELAEEEMRQCIEQRKAAMAAAEKRAAEAQRGKERLERAKLLAELAFENAIEECNWPVKTLEMLRGWWCQHHRMALLQDHPQKAVEESERLLELLVKVGNQGVVSIGTEALQAHNDIINMLSSSGLTGQNAQNAASELWAALEQASIWTRLAAQGQLSSDDLAKTSTKSSREAERAALAARVAPDFQDLSPEVVDDAVDLPDAGVGSRPEQEGEIHDDLPVPDYFSSNQELVDYFKNMIIGTWVDFVTADRKLVAAKLSWISPISHRLLFVTARGTKHSVESAENLAMMVKLDRVRLRRAGLGENGFDSSYRRALDVLSEKARLDEQDN